ncbi:hypothetical protein ARZXY2_1564 [Arthrobacter sp. ZXY-2]|nr:hypothetical protein ARZXY2_1564 [Arthrobacter sp. ZXY-2]
MVCIQSFARHVSGRSFESQGQVTAGKSHRHVQKIVPSEHLDQPER